MWKLSIASDNGLSKKFQRETQWKIFKNKQNKGEIASHKNS